MLICFFLGPLGFEVHRILFVNYHYWFFNEQNLPRFLDKQGYINYKRNYLYESFSTYYM